MTEIQTLHLSLICLTSEQETFLTGSILRSILCALRWFLSDQVTPFLKFTNYLPKVPYGICPDSQASTSFCCWQQSQSVLTWRLRSTTAPILSGCSLSIEASMSSCPVYSRGRVILVDKDAGGGAKENHALSAASWSNSPVLDSAPNVAEKPFGLFYMSSPITSQSFDKSSFWNKL